MKHSHRWRLASCLFFLLGLMSAGTALALPAAAVDDDSPPRLNVLFIAIDDLRNELDCYGQTRAHSPCIDRLASQGLRFDRAYCQFSICNPSRASLLTGLLRPDTTGVLDNNTPFRRSLPQAVTLPQLFRQHGYKTISLGKIFHPVRERGEDGKARGDAASWDVVEEYSPTPLGQKGEGRNLTEGALAWCRWLAAEGGDDDQPDGQVATAAISYLEQFQNEPFFLAVGFHKPHDPFIAPQPYFDLHPAEDLTLHRDPADASPLLEQSLGGGGFQRAFDRFTDLHRSEFLRSYLAGVSFTDAQVGRVLDALDRLQLRDRTIVVLFGDHGYHLGERGWWNKNTLFELSTRAPLIVAAPGSKAAGEATRAIVEFLDIYPTLADLCGLPAPTELQGKSFRPLLDDPRAPGKPAAFTQVKRGAIDGRSVRTDRYRYTEWDSGKQGFELYDHQNDPGEWHNLAANPALADVRETHRKLLHQP